MFKPRKKGINTNMRFYGRCIELSGRKITQMVDDAKPITRKTFLKHVKLENLQQIEESLGYSRHPRQGMTMASDCYVSYYKSNYNGKPCVYFDHSRIEHVFI